MDGFKPSGKILNKESYMKRLWICIFAFVSLLFIACSQNDSQNGIDGSIPFGMDSGIKATVGSTQTPVMFIPGLCAGPGSAFYNMYEKFESQKDGSGNSIYTGRMSIALLPKLSVPVIGDSFNYAWHTIIPGEYYDRDDWIASGNTDDNLPALKTQIESLLASTGATQVDLVGHSNGNALIRELLVYANNPTHSMYSLYQSLQNKIRSVVFIAGFASVDDADISDILTYLDDVAPDSLLPANVNYYAVKSTTDANNNVSTDLLKNDPLNYLPDDFDSCIFTLGSGYTKENYYLQWTNNGYKSIDHEYLPTHIMSISKVFKWLTGQDYAAPSSNPSTVTISGRIIVQDGCSDINPCNQSVLTNGLVEAKYYSKTSGEETGTAGSGSSSLSSNGRYTITNVSTNSDKYLKITVTDYNKSVTRGGSTYNAKSVYFIADRIVQNCNNLDFYDPKNITDAYADGKVSIKIVCAYSALGRNDYTYTDPVTETTVTRSADTYSGHVSTYYYPTMDQDYTCLPSADPSTIKSVILKNHGSTDVNSGGNEYNFIDPNNDGDHTYDYLYFASMHVYVTAQLNAGNEVKVQLHGYDRYDNIRDHIMYLYR